MYSYNINQSLGILTKDYQFWLVHYFILYKNVVRLILQYIMVDQLLQCYSSIRYIFVNCVNDKNLYERLVEIIYFVMLLEIEYVQLQNASVLLRKFSS